MLKIGDFGISAQLENTPVAHILTWVMRLMFCMVLNLLT